MLMQRHTRCDLKGFCRLETRGLHLLTSVRSKCSLRISSLDLRVSMSKSRAIAYGDVYVRVPLAQSLHAVGHNLGGEHPFYDQELVKPGESGGLMDYGPRTDPRPLPHLCLVFWSSFDRHTSQLPAAFITPPGATRWAGETQFGTFNRLRICPVIEVPCWLPV